MKSDREINIFNISFLDVFCCALGAMILIFILDTRSLSNNVEEARSQYMKKAQEAEKAERDVRYAVEKYRLKAREADRQRKLAEESTLSAQNARDEAQDLRERALAERERAIKSEQLARKRQSTLEKIHHEAMEQERVARESAENAQSVIEQLQVEISRRGEKEKQLIAEIDKLQSSKADAKEEIATLRKIANERYALDRAFSDLSKRHQELKKRFEDLEGEKAAMAEALNQVKNNTLKSQKLSSNYQRRYEQAKKDLEKIRSQYRNIVSEKQALSARLRNKNQELRLREKEIPQWEKKIRQLEQEIRAKRTKLERLSDKEEEKSLFGIRLSYHRIVFLFDRSGSIVDNNWKKVIVDTCKEILEHCEVDEFAVIAFSSDMLFFPGKKGRMLAGSKENKKKAIKWLTSKMPFGGSTRVDEALRIAYEDYGRLDAIFLLTDGLPSSRHHTPQRLQRDIIKYIEKQSKINKSTKIITIAIGYPPARAEQYKEIYKYLHKISELTNGQYLGR